MEGLRCSGWQCSLAAVPPVTCNTTLRAPVDHARAQALTIFFVPDLDIFPGDEPSLHQRPD